MIERVARVLAPLAWAALNVSDTSVHKKNREASIYKARLVIEAMREPTDAMWSVAEEGLFDGTEEIARYYWSTMIDEALK